MNLDIENWKQFKLGKVLSIKNGSGITKAEISQYEGDFPAVQSGESNNGILGYIDLDYCKEMGYAYSLTPCLTVARSGSAGFVALQPTGCVVGDSAKILHVRDTKKENIYVLLFFQTLLTANRFKYDYGRKVSERKYASEIIELPVLHNKDGSVFIDKGKKYSDEGFYPDFEYMEKYIKSLNFQQTITRVKSIHKPLETNRWEPKLLKSLYHIQMGNKLDKNKMTMDAPSINFVSRISFDNGVDCKVDYIEGLEPFRDGLVTVALGGSYLGSSFVQLEPFYTAQNVSVLTPLYAEMDILVNLFITRLIKKESESRYCAFGRELNAHINKDFTINIPVDEDGEPDFEYMKNYMKSLPYSDKL